VHQRRVYQRIVCRRFPASGPTAARLPLRADGRARTQARSPKCTSVDTTATPVTGPGSLRQGVAERPLCPEWRRCGRGEKTAYVTSFSCTTRDIRMDEPAAHHSRRDIRPGGSNNTGGLAEASRRVPGGSGATLA
jgi:hypothetical protein